MDALEACAYVGLVASRRKGTTLRRLPGGAVVGAGVPLRRKPARCRLPFRLRGIPVPSSCPLEVVGYVENAFVEFPNYLISNVL